MRLITTLFVYIAIVNGPFCLAEETKPAQLKTNADGSTTIQLLANTSTPPQDSQASDALGRKVALFHSYPAELSDEEASKDNSIIDAKSKSGEPIDLNGPSDTRPLKASLYDAADAIIALNPLQLSQPILPVDQATRDRLSVVETQIQQLPAIPLDDLFPSTAPIFESIAIHNSGRSVTLPAPIFPAPHLGAGQATPALKGRPSGYVFGDWQKIGTGNSITPSRPQQTPVVTKPVTVAAKGYGTSTNGSGSSTAHNTETGYTGP